MARLNALFAGGVVDAATRTATQYCLGRVSCPVGRGRPFQRRSVRRRYQDRQTNEWQGGTSCFDVVCWAGLAENVAQSLTKGTRVMVTGRLDQRSWKTNEGDKRSKVAITADDIDLSS